MNNYLNEKEQKLNQLIIEIEDNFVQIFNKFNKEIIENEYFSKLKY